MKRKNEPFSKDFFSKKSIVVCFNTGFSENSLIKRNKGGGGGGIRTYFLKPGHPTSKESETMEQCCCFPDSGFFVLVSA